MPRSGAAIIGRTSKTDNYSTPPEATRALLSREGFSAEILEPCAGEGKMVEVLDAHGYSVTSSDIRDLPELDYPKSDFLITPQRWCMTGVDNVITNPPFSIAQAILEQALSLTRRKVALFLRIQFLEGKKRKALLESSPLEFVYIFSDRVSLYPEGTENKGGGTQCFCWYVWRHGYKGDAKIRFLDSREFK